MSTALYFGSFNPLHNGHIAIGEYFSDLPFIEEVWFVLSPQSPFKVSGSDMATVSQRMEMLKLALAGSAVLKPCFEELNLPTPSYTYNTLQHLERKHPGRQFILLMGQDSWRLFNQWSNFEWILENYRIYVYPRNDTEDFSQSDESDSLLSHSNVNVVNAPFHKVSSSLVRKKIRLGDPVEHLLPAPVLRFIQEGGLYQ